MVLKYLNNHAETSENHRDDTLQTKYYKTSKDKALLALENYFKNNTDFEITSISNERGEMSVITKRGKKAFIVITVIMVRPFQTAIDFSVTAESAFPFDFGFSTKLIQKLYNQMSKELPLISNNH
ncbi:cytosolic protein [Oceanobacillus bengalensis]|uniref:Cytosolic protein n=1 Tax=Oceanobacillus bengalensis TaxID=1435466 RepID=A0A494YWS8_9BACI|nr:cytosolic protein [Oceanobacillus bengalensis]